MCQTVCSSVTLMLKIDLYGLTAGLFAFSTNSFMPCGRALIVHSHHVNEHNNVTKAATAKNRILDKCATHQSVTGQGGAARPGFLPLCILPCSLLAHIAAHQGLSRKAFQYQ